MFEEIDLERRVGLFDFLRARSPQDRFAERVVKRLRERGSRHEITYNADQFSLEVGERHGVLYLGNIFTDLQGYPRDQQAAQLDRALNVFFESPSEISFDDAAPKLMPVVRNLMHLQATALASERDPSTELWQPYAHVAGPLGALLAIDLPTSVAMVSHEMLATWGCSFGTAMDRAMENLIPTKSRQVGAYGRWLLRLRLRGHVRLLTHPHAGTVSGDSGTG